jgi:hypothetical protein
MSNQGWVSMLNDAWQIGAGATLNTAATAVISPQNAGTKDYVISPYEWRLGKTIKIFASGLVSSGGTASNLTIFLRTATPTTLSTSPAVALGTGSVINAPWHLWARIRCLAVAGTGNTLETEGTIIVGNTAAPAFATANAVMIDLPMTSAAVDVTASQSLQLAATLSAAFGAITCQTFIVTSWN